MTLLNAAGHTISGAGAIDGSGTAFTLQNAGTLAVTGSAGLTLGPSVTLANFDGGTRTLTGGTYNISSTFQFTGADIVTNAANIRLNGAAALIRDEHRNNALRNFTTNSGTMEIGLGATLTVPS